MKYIIDPILGLVSALFGLVIHPCVAALFAWSAWHVGSPMLLLGVAPFGLGLLACLSIKWTGADETGYLRGDLPTWAYPWCTPDERAPGDVRGEAALIWVYKTLGPTAAAIYWHLERNRGMGLSFLLSRKTSDRRYLEGNAWGFVEIPSGAWRWQRKICPWVYVGVGTQTTMAKDQMWIRPWVGIKVTHNGNP